MSKAPGCDCIPVVVLKNYESELSWTLQYVPEGILYPRLLEGLIWECWEGIWECWGRSTPKKYRPHSFLSIVFKRLLSLEMRPFYFEYGFRSSQSTADLVTIVSDRTISLLIGLVLLLIYPRLYTRFGMNLIEFFKFLNLIFWGFIWPYFIFSH